MMIFVLSILYIKELVEMIEMNSKGTAGYVIHKTTDNNVLVCKILKECLSEEEAIEALVRLLSGNVTEKQLLKENR